MSAGTHKINRGFGTAKGNPLQTWGNSTSDRLFVIQKRRGTP
jgi:hypothetical protein